VQQWKQTDLLGYLAPHCCVFNVDSSPGAVRPSILILWSVCVVSEVIHLSLCCAADFNDQGNRFITQGSAFSPVQVLQSLSNSSSVAETF